MTHNSNPETISEADKFVQEVVRLCSAFDLDGIASGFTEDCVCRFGIMPEMRGREAVRNFFEKRSRRQKNYVLKKNLRAMMGDTLAISFSGSWDDPVTGKSMHGHGAEIWKLRDGKIDVWEIGYNVGEVGVQDDGNLT